MLIACTRGCAFFIVSNYWVSLSPIPPVFCIISYIVVGKKCSVSIPLIKKRCFLFPSLNEALRNLALSTMKNVYFVGILLKKWIVKWSKSAFSAAMQRFVLHSSSRYATITFYCDCTADRSPRMDLLPAGIGRYLCRCNIRETANRVTGLWRFAIRCNSLFHFKQSRKI